MPSKAHLASRQATGRHGHAASQPQDRAQYEWTIGQGLPGPGGGCDACVAAPPPRQCWCPSSLACLHGPALRQVRVKPGHSRGRRKEVERLGHHPPGPPTHSGTRLSPLMGSCIPPLGPFPLWGRAQVRSQQQGPDRLFAPAQEEALPVLCGGPCSLQAPATKMGQPRTAGEDPQRRKKTGSSESWNHAQGAGPLWTGVSAHPLCCSPQTSGWGSPTALIIPVPTRGWSSRCSVAALIPH